MFPGVNLHTCLSTCIVHLDLCAHLHGMYVLSDVCPTKWKHCEKKFHINWHCQKGAM